MRPGIAVAGRVAQRHATRNPGLFQLDAELHEVVGIVWELVITRGPHRLYAIVYVVAADAKRQRHPAAVAIAIARRDVVPAAVFFAQVIRDVGDVEQLFRQ